MKKLTLLTLASATIMVSCATMNHGSDQAIRVTSTPSGASCQITSSRGKWQIKRTPATVKVARGAGELTIQCKKHGRTGIAKLKSEFHKKAVFGGVSGMTFDVATGAAYTYPKTVRVRIK